MRDFRRVLFAPPPGLGEALGEVFGEALGEVFGEALGEVFGEALGEALGEVFGEALGEALGEAFVPCSTFFCNLKSYSNISLITIK